MPLLRQFCKTPCRPTIASKLNEFRVRKKKNSLNNSREEGLQSILNLPSVSGLQSMSTLNSISGLTISNRPSILSHLLPSISGLQSVNSPRASVTSHNSRILLNRSKSMHEICKGYSQHSFTSNFSSRFTKNGEICHLPAPNHILLQCPTPAISTASFHSGTLPDSSLKTIKTAYDEQHANKTNSPKNSQASNNYLNKTSSSHTSFSNSSQNQKNTNNSKITNQISSQTKNNLQTSSNQQKSSNHLINTQSQFLISATSAAQMQDEKCLAQDYLGYPYYPYSTNYQYEFTMPKRRYAMNLELYEKLLSDPTVFQFPDPFLSSGESLQMTAPVCERIKKNLKLELISP